MYWTSLCFQTVAVAVAVTLQFVYTIHVYNIVHIELLFFHSVYSSFEVSLLF